MIGRFIADFYVVDRDILFELRMHLFNDGLIDYSCTDIRLVRYDDGQKSGRLQIADSLRGVWIKLQSVRAPRRE